MLESGATGRDRNQVAEGRMWPCRIVVGDPATDDLLGMVEAEEQRLVQDLIPHLRIEGLSYSPEIGQ